LEKAAAAGKKVLTTQPEVYARETVLLAKYPAKVPVILQAIKIGELGIVANPCETFVEIGLEIKKNSPLRPTFTIELANGYNGYLPTPEHHKLGGYETWRARSSYLEAGASPKIIDTWMQLLREVTQAPAARAPNANINDYGPPEYGHGLTEKDALDGWIALFDGKTTFGWTDAKVEGGLLVAGTSAARFTGYDIKLEAARPGKLAIPGGFLNVSEPGHRRIQTDRQVKPRPVAFQLDSGLALRSIAIRPHTTPLFSGSLAGWKRIDHPKLPKEQRPSWALENGMLRAVGGPGAMEHEKLFGDGIFQIEARMNVRHANGGFFFRAIPADFMNGYEAQLYSRCIDNDPARPATWATGAIDDRQNARRLVSRDGHFLLMTVLADGPHIATWVNGHQTVSWTDTRPPHPNPRQGKRLDPGAIQLQAHDPATDITFRKIAAAAW
jgi:hypothetical protein